MGRWVDGSATHFHAQPQPQVHGLAIKPVIRAELSVSFNTIGALDAVVQRLALNLQDIPRPALLLAGQAFAQCRRS